MTLHLRRRAGTVALLSLASLLGGCGQRALVLRIPDFESSRVEGLTLWSASEGDTPLAATSRIRLGAPFERNGREVLEWFAEDLDGRVLSAPMSGRVDRNLANPDEITVTLYLDPGAGFEEYRVSTFNEIGDSPLTEASVLL